MRGFSADNKFILIFAEIAKLRFIRYMEWRHPQTSKRFNSRFLYPTLRYRLCGVTESLTSLRLFYLVLAITPNVGWNKTRMDFILDGLSISFKPHSSQYCLCNSLIANASVKGQLWTCESWPFGPSKMRYCVVKAKLLRAQRLAVELCKDVSSKMTV